MKYKNKIVKVGVAVLIGKDNKVLLIKRKGSHGEGAWAPPGGHIDFGESVLRCARRETKEETGIEINDLRVTGFTEDLFKKEKKHYITVWVKANWKAEKAKICNSEASEINWFSWNELPNPLFLCFENFIKGKILPR